MNTLLAPPTATPCAEWCNNHEMTGDICYARDINIKIDDSTPWQVHEVGVGLAAETTGGTVVTLTVNGYGMGELSLDYAEKIAVTLSAMVAAGRRAGTR